jgi:hypothetical protein
MSAAKPMPQQRRLDSANVFVSRHPLAQHKLTLLRRKQTEPKKVSRGDQRTGDDAGLRSDAGPAHRAGGDRDAADHDAGRQHGRESGSGADPARRPGHGGRRLASCCRRRKSGTWGFIATSARSSPFPITTSCLWRRRSNYAWCSTPCWRPAARPRRRAGAQGLGRLAHQVCGAGGLAGRHPRRCTATSPMWPFTWPRWTSGSPAPATGSPAAISGRAWATPATASLARREMSKPGRFED